ncbi:hypothetical protein NE237_014976 [Protea cynaroides]|uniref:Uncharacterized protein n=1 Tax=Protea cynaroides TaxID=273540 RepID=A0A9Q0QQH1_9MAGN|nr:hypothetical protein NE237_014976 [Protea cynaroides]
MIKLVRGLSSLIPGLILNTAVASERTMNRVYCPAFSIPLINYPVVCICMYYDCVMECRIGPVNYVFYLVLHFFVHFCLNLGLCLQLCTCTPHLFLRWDS